MTAATQTGSVPSTAWDEMNDFARTHKASTLLLMVATNDYAAARCRAENMLSRSLVMGAQALEKYLKAYLVMVNPSRNVRKLSHDITKLLQEVDGLAPNLSLSRFMPLAQKFNGHYRTRYPDDPRASTNMTTADIIELDELILCINENLPCPKTVKYRSGLFAAISFSVDHQGQVSPTEHWIKVQNRSLAPLLERIDQEQKEVLRQLSPSLVL